MDHDQYFRRLVKNFLPELIDLLMPTWVPRFHFDQAVWIEQEIFTDPPQGDKQRVDILVQLPTVATNPPLPRSPENMVVYLHIEIEGRDPLEVFDRRMQRYYETLKREGYTAFPLVVFFHVQADGRGVRHVDDGLWEETTNRFSYNYIALPGLDVEAYRDTPNMLGQAWLCLMRMARERRMRVAADAYERIARSTLDEAKKRLLAEFVDTYGPRDPNQHRDLDALLRDPERVNAMLLQKTAWEERDDRVREEIRSKVHAEVKAEVEAELRPVLEQEIRAEVAREERLNKQRDLLLRLLTTKFPNVSADVLRPQLANRPEAQLDALFTQAIMAATIAELGLRETAS